MKILWNFVILFAVGATLALLLAQNQLLFGQVVRLRLDIGFLHIRLLPVRLDVLMLGTLALGFLWCWILATPHTLSQYLAVRRLRKDNQRLEALATKQAAASALVPGSQQEK